MIVDITEVEHYTDRLFRIRTQKPEDFSFVAGQFVMIGLPDSDVQRAYSITSAPQDDFLEFYSIKVQDGPLTSRLQHVQSGDELEVSEYPTGTLLLSSLEQGTDLWMLATGTGVAPFMSLLRDGTVYDRYERVHLVWSVRERAELDAYYDWLQEQPVNFIPVVTRDNDWSGVSTRIDKLIQAGDIVSSNDPATDHVMLCGSIEFNKSLKQHLTDNGWTEGKRKLPGTFVLERAFVS
jgi:ferredoxin--NADP+ reductase